MTSRVAPNASVCGSLVCRRCMRSLAIASTDELPPAELPARCPRCDRRLRLVDLIGVDLNERRLSEVPCRAG